MVAIETIADQFEQQGGQTEPVVVFTRDPSTLVKSIAADCEGDAVLTAGNTCDRVIVPLRGGDNLGQIHGFVGTFLPESDAVVTIFSVAESDDTASRGELPVRGACD